MKNKPTTIKSSVHAYVAGFCASLTLTFLAFAVTTAYADVPLVHSRYLIVILCLFAFAQLVVQARYFLHLGISAKSRWNTIVFAYVFLMTIIIGVGSIWIMNNLSNNMMPPTEMDHYMMNQ